MRRLWLGLGIVAISLPLLGGAEAQDKDKVEVKKIEKKPADTKKDDKKEEKKGDASSGDKAGPKDNTPPEGFTALFNGKTLTGWKGLVEFKERGKKSEAELEKMQEEADKKFLPHWTVKDGILCYDGKGNSLQTVYDYGDIELHVDWKIGPKGDSGIYLRGQPQVQIWDNPEGSGGLYNNKKNPSKPLKFADRPVGQWNTFRIVMKGERVSVWLNDVLVVDNTPLENYWEPGKPLPKEGPIELQHHGDPLFFKNIYVKELKD
jgi:hypothetical protein